MKPLKGLKCGAGGKPSTWFPPGRLVGQEKQDNIIINIILHPHANARYHCMAVSSTSSSSSRQHHDEHGHGHTNGHCSIGSVSHGIVVSVYHCGLHMLRNNKTLSSTSYTLNYVVGVGRVGAGLGPEVVVGRRVTCILRLVGALHQLSSLWLSFASSLPSSS